MNNNIVTPKCIVCGKTHNKSIVSNKFYCQRCGNLNYVLSDLDSKLEKMFYDADHKLYKYEWKDADDIYSQIISNEKSKEKEYQNNEVLAMAYFGRIQVYFGIVYITGFTKDSIDPVPTFAKPNINSLNFEETEYYKNLQSLQLSNEVRDEYTKKFEELKQHQGIISNKDKDKLNTDVFICTKISRKIEGNPDLEGNTKDSEYAEDIYDNLVQNKKLRKNINVFYSAKSIIGLYNDSQIHANLVKSKVMILVATSSEHLESRWVKSEWSRWLNYIESDLKEPKTILLYIPKSFNNSSMVLPEALKGKNIQIMDTKEKLYDKVVEILKEYYKTKEKYDVDKIEKIDKAIETLDDYDKSKKSIYDKVYFEYKKLTKEEKSKITNYPFLRKAQWKIRSKYYLITTLTLLLLMTVAFLAYFFTRPRVEFLNDDGKLISKEIIWYDSYEIKEPEMPTKDSDYYYNYTFEKWNKDLNDITTSTKVYAQYSKEAIYYTLQVKNDSLCGNVNLIDGAYTYEEIVKLEALANTGYEFIGWYIGEQIISSSSNYNYSMDHNDIIIEAKYSFISPEGFIVISTPQELLNMTSNNNYILERNIDMTDYEWLPLDFNGTLDGNNHTISNITIKCNQSNTGFFGRLKGNVKNLTLTNLQVISDGYNRDNIGGLAGSILSNVEINNVKVQGTIQSNSFKNLGGIAGYINVNDLSKITNLETQVDLLGSSNVGGIFGYCLSEQLEGITLSDYRNYGSVNGKDFVGGIIGYVNTYNKINYNNCTNDGIITKDNQILENNELFGKVDIIVDLTINYYIREVGKTNCIIYKTSKIAGLVGQQINAEVINIDGFVLPISQDITLSEKVTDNVINYYYDRNIYIIKYYDGDDKIKEVEYEYEAIIDKFVPEIPYGYEFDCWKNDANEFAEAKMPAHNVELHAYFKPIKYKINYELDGGNNSNNNPTYYTIEQLIEFSDASKVGYTFQGWYNDNVFTSKISKIETGSSNDITLYAKFSPNTYFITYNAGGGTVEGSTLEVVFDQSYFLPTPVKTGYTFIGYSYNGEIVNQSKYAYTQNIEVVATWKANEYTITLDLNSSLIKTEIDITSTKYSVIIDCMYTLPIPSAKYYEFLGWYTSSSGGIQYTTSDGVSIEKWSDSEEITLYAHWQQQYIDCIYIATKDEFSNIRDNMSGKYKIVTDLDLSEVSAISSFTGEIDGLGHTLSAWKGVQNSVGNLGLISKNSGTIKNLNIKNFTISHTDPSDSGVLNVGLVCGYNNGVIDNVHIISGCSIDVNLGSLSQNNDFEICAGLICGYNEGGTISNCSAANNTLKAYCSSDEGRAYCFSGGICGKTVNGYITNVSSSTNKISATAKADHNTYIFNIHDDFGYPYLYNGGVVGYSSGTTYSSINGTGNDLTSVIDNNCDKCGNYGYAVSQKVAYSNNDIFK